MEAPGFHGLALGRISKQVHEDDVWHGPVWLYRYRDEGETVATTYARWGYLGATRVV